ncbi:spore protein YqfQ [Bacillus coahuilensis]|uniref:spore protein YqfQ n=1 Tax=Bacillus coahuilensis TaxID=408580 RepID=UPI0001851151|nr:spore protein YqfQ [Bacillus coahuilensis]
MIFQQPPYPPQPPRGNPFGMGRGMRGFSNVSNQMRNVPGQRTSPLAAILGKNSGNATQLANNSGSGGILSKLFQRGAGAGDAASVSNAANALTGFERSAGATSGILSGAMNPSSINSFLTNTQQVIKTAQQFGPMVQQYGPLVKNLPAMYKLYKGLKDVDTDEEVETPSDTSIVNEETTQSDPKPNTSKKTSTSKPKKSTTLPINEENLSTKNRASKPKLYV